MWLPGQQINSCCPVWGKCTYSPLPVIQLHIEPPVYFSAVSQWLWIRSLNCRQRIEILLNVWGIETDSSLPPGCARSSGRDASWKLPGVITVYAALLLLDFWVIALLKSAQVSKTVCLVPHGLRMRLWVCWPPCSSCCGLTSAHTCLGVFHHVMSRPRVNSNFVAQHNRKGKVHVYTMACTKFWTTLVCTALSPLTGDKLSSS